jgi:hypothetical protein
LGFIYFFIIFARLNIVPRYIWHCVVMIDVMVIPVYL